jgi:hypothetical protein
MERKITTELESKSSSSEDARYKEPSSAAIIRGKLLMDSPEVTTNLKQVTHALNLSPKKQTKEQK